MSNVFSTKNLKGKIFLNTLLRRSFFEIFLKTFHNTFFFTRIQTLRYLALESSFLLYIRESIEVRRKGHINPRIRTNGMYLNKRYIAYFATNFPWNIHSIY